MLIFVRSAGTIFSVIVTLIRKLLDHQCVNEGINGGNFETLSIIASLDAFHLAVITERQSSLHNLGRSLLKRHIYIYICI